MKVNSKDLETIILALEKKLLEDVSVLSYIKSRSSSKFKCISESENRELGYQHPKDPLVFISFAGLADRDTLELWSNDETVLLEQLLKDARELIKLVKEQDRKVNYYLDRVAKL